MSIPWVDGLSTDPPVLGRHKICIKLNEKRIVPWRYSLSVSSASLLNVMCVIC